MSTQATTRLQRSVVCHPQYRQESNFRTSCFQPYTFTIRRASRSGRSNFSQVRSETDPSLTTTYHHSSLLDREDPHNSEPRHPLFRPTVPVTASILSVYLTADVLLLLHIALPRDSDRSRIRFRNRDVLFLRSPLHPHNLRPYQHNTKHQPPNPLFCA